ncbi:MULTISPECIES: 2Fe-2S iron-sulfur cluster-binding protein [unclassified Arthrobacter]|uniref:2Fe-2S iron-sulfur cluster-binding protein n=1 Tax=unclassified Arthrobacter TaxID=235627 RepID=UPI001BECDF59|nr:MULTISPECIES: 2Fe-2S iron-sulfur cluster-binding protein [unclassified Arthrobacter]MBT2535471.1 2Fe-2S iron-sulfur cluster binding domain-containing protein [Arthrobacter sp. ISL-69]MBT2597857.1 2Fe-2S iron-sulfur cluster binding domain-containing protein [Arthrobacter sp. ISL-72]
MSKTLINVIDREGATREVEWEPEQSLMETLRDNDFPVLASCGGTVSCATCHVFLEKPVLESLADRSEDELELLEDAEHYNPEASRLSCQVQQCDSLGGINVIIAPEED